MVQMGQWVLGPCAVLLVVDGWMFLTKNVIASASFATTFFIVLGRWGVLFVMFLK